METIKYTYEDDCREATFEFEIEAAVSVAVSAGRAMSRNEAPEGASVDVRRVTLHKIVATFGAKTVERKPGADEARTICEWFKAEVLPGIAAEVEELLADEAAKYAGPGEDW